MIQSEQALKIAEAWIDAWNRRDLDAIMEHYADSIEFRSPLIVTLMGILDGKIEGKALLRTYFAKGLETTKGLKFQLQQVLIGVDSLTIYYHRESGRNVAEVLTVDDMGRVVNVRVHYSAPISS